MSQWYKLVGHNPVPCGVREWDRQREARGDLFRVARTTVGPSVVSTVFLGLNHEWRPAFPPKLFETMVFFDDTPGKDLFGVQVRYCTWNQAVKGHQKIVRQVRRQLDALSEQTTYLIMERVREGVHAGAGGG